MKNICILILLLLNISMGIVLLNNNKKTRELQTLVVQQRRDILILSGNLERCYQASVRVNNHTVKSFLNAVGAGYELVNTENSDVLFMLIPPFPCDVCLEKEIQNVQNYRSEKEMIVVAPEFRMRDIKAQLQNNREIKFIPYDVESIKGMPGADMEGVIYFRTAGEIVYDIFVPDKSNTEYSTIYLNELN